MHFFLDYGLGEVGEVLEGLLRVKPLHVFEFVGVVAEWERLAVVAMFNCDDEGLHSLSHYYCPLSGIWYSVASILSANIEDDGSNVGVEVVFDSVVSLFPVSGGFVVEVVKDLVEPELVLTINERV